MKSFAEFAVKDAALAWLEALGYAVPHGPDIAAAEPDAGAQRTEPPRRGAGRATSPGTLLQEFRLATRGSEGFRFRTEATGVNRLVVGVAESAVPHMDGKDLARRATRKLEYVDLARCLEDLRVPPGNRLHKLERDRNAYDVEVTDYQ